MFQPRRALGPKLVLALEAIPPLSLCGNPHKHRSCWNLVLGCMGAMERTRVTGNVVSLSPTSERERERVILCNATCPPRIWTGLSFDRRCNGAFLFQVTKCPLHCARMGNGPMEAQHTTMTPLPGAVVGSFLTLIVRYIQIPMLPLGAVLSVDRHFLHFGLSGKAFDFIS